MKPFTFAPFSFRPGRSVPTVLAALLLLAAMASGASAKARPGYWSGALGRHGSAEVEMLIRNDGRYMLQLNTEIISPSGARVDFKPRTKIFCPASGSCGKQGDGFGFSFHCTSRSSMKGRWWLDRSRYPGYRVPRGNHAMRARWLARPRLRFSSDSVKAGHRIMVVGTGYIPGEKVWVVGNQPIFQLIPPPLRANSEGKFRRKVTISPLQYPGFYPDVYVFQRSCLTTCFVKGSADLTVLPP